MKNIKDNTIYCVYCGKENKIESKKCSKCKKELDPKNRPFRDYIMDSIKDKVSGDIEDNLFSLITNFIKTHLYGFVLTCSVIISAVSVVVSVASNGNEFDVVDKKPEISIGYIGEGKIATDIMVNYVDAINAGNLIRAKKYELREVYPEIYESLIGKKVNNKVKFLNEYIIYDNRDIYLSKDFGYYMESSSLTGTEGLDIKYGDYNAKRHAILFSYCAGNDCNGPGRSFSLVYEFDMIEVDGNYYVAGNRLDTEYWRYNNQAYNALINNNGDTSKITKEDILSK